MGGRPKQLKDIDELKTKPTVMRWQKGLKAGPHRKTALYNLGRYLRWRKAQGMESDPDRLIDECLGGTVRTLVTHAQPIVDFAQSEVFEGSGLETRKKNAKDVRSFYSAQQIKLPDTRISAGESVPSVTQEMTATKYLLAVKTVLLKGRLNPRGRAMILTMLQSGMDASTTMNVFNFYGYPQLAKALGEELSRWDTSRCPIRIDLVRPKSGARYYTYLDVDAIEALREWLGRRGRIQIREPRASNELPTSDPIFVTHFGEPMQPGQAGDIFREAGKKAGVNRPGPKRPEFKGATNRHVFQGHEVRDTMVTLARKAKADVIAANFFVGHSIDKLKYDKSPWNDEDFFRGEYLKIARPYLNVVSNFSIMPAATKQLDERIAQLEEMVRSLLEERTRSESVESQITRRGF